MALDRNARRTLAAGGKTFSYCALEALDESGGSSLARRPYCLRVLLENVLRHIGVNDIGEEDVRRLAGWSPQAEEIIPVPFHPARVLMQDYTGIPTLVDLAAMRDAVVAAGGDGRGVNPQIPVDLVIDHSLIVDEAGHAGAMSLNLVHEFRRNSERYQLAKWAQSALDGIRVVPPGKGILHQVNIEHIATLVRSDVQEDGAELAYCDTMVGTDSHSTMVNGIGVLGWGVGGIEAEAAMLGLPLVVPLGRIVGVRLVGELREGVTATDIVLTLTQRLRQVGVVDAFVEFYGPSASRLSVADRVTLANMSPEYGSTCGFFPIDRATIDYLELTGRSPAHIQLVEAYARAQHLWREDEAPEPDYSEVVTFDLGEVEPSVAGPRRPQDRVPLAGVGENFREQMKVAPADHGGIDHGAVVLAAITSCTNTSNPAVMIGAGLVARKAVARGLVTKPWVKTSLTPGSRVVSGYLEATGLQADLDLLGFQIAGFGCATCGGNSGRLDPAIEEEIVAKGAVAVAVLSGNRNFEARIHPLAKANYLMSPPLVIAYALAGTIDIDLTSEPLGMDGEGRPVFLRDIWPSSQEIASLLAEAVTPELFREYYADLFAGDASWDRLEAPRGQLFPWQPSSTYIRRPPYFDGLPAEAAETDRVEGARILLLLGDSITTDHISPVGDIAPDSPAGRLLSSHQVSQRDFNAYGSRRANHEVMVRGTFANIRLRNQMVPGIEGGITRHLPSGEVLPIFDAAMRYAQEGVPLVIVAGREYGCGSSRDWAAKGTRLLGARAVLASSFERIHRSNLIAMGVLPLQFPEGVDRASLGLDGSERVDLEGFEHWTQPGETLTARFTFSDGTVREVEMRGRLDTANELKVWRAGGILPFVFRRLLSVTQAGGTSHVA